MDFMRSGPRVRRLAMCAALLGAVVGALIGQPRKTEENSRGTTILGEPSQRPRDYGVPQELPVTPEPADAPSGALPRPEPLGVDAMPETSAGALRRSIELFRKGDMAGGDREKALVTDPVQRSLSEWAAVRFGWVGFERIVAFTRRHPE